MTKGFPKGFDSEQLGFYVYVLFDPRKPGGTPFYVGKGKAERLYSHLQAAIASPISSDKLDLIRTILAEKLEPNHIIVRHGLTSKEAYEVEAAFLDYFGEGLTNVASGIDSDARGWMTIDEAIAEYQADELSTDSPCLMVSIRSQYRRGMGADELYEATRRAWKMSMKNALKVKYVLAVSRGIVREVFVPLEWTPVEGEEGRLEFVGTVALEAHDLVGKRVTSKKGAANPVRYLNI